jgi:hypothetical protein
VAETESQRLERFWLALQPLLAVEQCRSCECLQGALVELQLALEELPEAGEPVCWLHALRDARRAEGRHGCLGCAPCQPGDLLAAFYRAQADGVCACGQSCREPSPTD